MPATVPALRPEPGDSLIRVGQPVSSVTWQQLGGLTNWLRGKGAQLVPWCTPFTTVAAGVSDTYRFRAKTRSSAIQRVWVVLVKCNTSGAESEVVLQAPPVSGTNATYAVSGGLWTPIVYVENLSSRSATEQEVSIEISGSVGTNTALVGGICCYEQDRPILSEDATDYGVDLYTLGSGQPIADFSYQSVGGVYDALTNADARRVGIFSWSVGDATSAAQVSATPASLLQLAVPVLVRKLGRTATSGSVKWAAYCYMSSTAAGNGTVRLTHTNASGTSTDDATVSWTTPQWTTTNTVSGFDCDDMTATDGRQSSTWDSLNFSLIGNGTNTLYVQSISVWQDD